MIKKPTKIIIFLIGFISVFTFSIQESKNFNQQNQLPVNNTRNQIHLDTGAISDFFSIFSGNKPEAQKQKIEVIPGGNSIGVTLHTKGVLIVGYAPVVDEKGRETFPAKEAGVQTGDVILKVNQNQALNDNQVAKEIDKSCKENRKITLEIKHNGMISQKVIQPIYCSETQRYRIGLYIRDEAAGVGTLTFIDPKTQIFGALGHVINDIDTNDRIELSDGRIVESTIYAIEKGKKGDPGEKIGSFMPESSFSGKIQKNTVSGIFGLYYGKIANPYFKSPVPVAWKSEIKTGPAKTYTVIKNNTIQEYDITIEKIMPYRTDNKNMIIKVTDPNLLEQTGGIIQGMSGSPIIQDGKIVGAVTHVFVNDATRGYGVFIEKMINDSGILDKAATARLGGFFFTCPAKLFSFIWIY